MTNITEREKKVLDNVTQVLDQSVFLGELIENIISGLPITGSRVEPGTPVNAVVAKETLTLTGVVVDGETLAISNPDEAGHDVYEFLSTESQRTTVVGSIPVDITDYTTKSSGTLTMDTQPTSGNTVTIGEKVYTFVPVGTDTADGEVSIGTDLAGAQAALVAAINGTDGTSYPHPLVSCGEFAADDAIITALVGGVAGDAIATTETFTAATNVFAAVTLGSGADCTAANAITALVAAITASDTQGVGAVDSTGDTIILTADASGDAGNSIEVVVDMANGSLTDDTTVLSGGVDGTVAAGLKALADGSYLYICPEGNTVTGRNWRRISLGSAY